jgi:hypothetical protein
MTRKLHDRTEMLSYRTVLLAQTGICSGTHPIALRSIPPQSPGFINKCIDNIVPTVIVCTFPNQKPWITGNSRIARVSAFKVRDMPSDKPSKKLCVKTGIRLNPIILIIPLVGCGRA